MPRNGLRDGCPLFRTLPDRLTAPTNNALRLARGQRVSAETAQIDTTPIGYLEIDQNHATLITLIGTILYYWRDLCYNWRDSRIRAN